MSVRLEEQIRSYTQIVDSMAPPVEDLLPAGLREEAGWPREVVEITVTPRPQGPRWWVPALAGAAAVLLVAFSVWVFSSRGPDDVVDSTPTSVPATPTTVPTPTTTPASAGFDLDQFPLVFSGLDRALSGNGWEPDIEVVATLEYEGITERRSANPDSDGRFTMPAFDECCRDVTLLTVTQGERTVVARIDRGVSIDRLDAELDQMTLAYGDAADVRVIVDNGGEVFTTSVVPDSDWWSMDFPDGVDIVEGTQVTVALVRDGVAFIDVTGTTEPDISAGVDMRVMIFEGRGFLPNTPLQVTINGASLPGGLVTDNGGHFVVDLAQRGVSLVPGDTFSFTHSDDVLEMIIPEVSFDSYDSDSGEASGSLSGVAEWINFGVMFIDEAGVSHELTSGHNPFETGDWAFRFTPLPFPGQFLDSGWIEAGSGDIGVKFGFDPATIDQS